MSHQTRIFNHTPKIFIDGTLDWDTDTFKGALLSSGYTFSGTHVSWESLSSYEVSGTGYTAGGVTLSMTTPSVSGVTTTFDLSDASFTNLTVDFRHFMIYAVKTESGVTNPPVALITFRDSEDTPTDISLSAVNFSLQFNADGIFRTVIKNNS